MCSASQEEIKQRENINVQLTYMPYPLRKIKIPVLTLQNRKKECWVINGSLLWIKNRI